MYVGSFQPFHTLSLAALLSLIDMEESKKLIRLKSKLVVLPLAQSLLIRLGKEGVLWKEAAASVIHISINPGL